MIQLTLMLMIGFLLVAISLLIDFLTKDWKRKQIDKAIKEINEEIIDLYYKNGGACKLINDYPSNVRWELNLLHATLRELKIEKTRL